jgi:hypothetical protein
LSVLLCDNSKDLILFDLALPIIGN